jgi:DNA repair exonuclease SbcCD ATPase subunit
MNARRVAIVLGLVVLAGATVGSAQGLGDVAARERQRRAKLEATKKAPVLTNEDLDKGRPPAAPGETPASQTSSESSSTPAGTSSEMRQPVDEHADRERPYRDAVSEARNQIEALEGHIKELGDKLNPMSGSFIYGATGSNNANEEAQVREELRQAEAELPQARQRLAEATQALEEAAQNRISAGR